LYFLIDKYWLGPKKWKLIGNFTDLTVAIIVPFELGVVEVVEVFIGH